MNKTSMTVCWFFSLAILAADAWATDLTAVTLFGCDDQGAVDPAFRNNSGPIDAAWGVLLYRGNVFHPASDSPPLQSERVRRRLSVQITAHPDTLDRNETGEILKTSGGEAELYLEREESQETKGVPCFMQPLKTVIFALAGIGSRRPAP